MPEIAAKRVTVLIFFQVAFRVLCLPFLVIGVMYVSIGPFCYKCASHLLEGPSP